MLSLPGYEIQEQIYLGKHSRVMRGTETKTERPVIIKTHAGDFPSTVDMNRLRHDYEIGREFNDESIIRHYGLVSFHHKLALIEEDFNARSLDELIPNDGFEADTFLTLAIQMAEGLAVIHSKNIIHRDVKPGNYVVHSDTLKIKLIDFGLSSELQRQFRTAAVSDKPEGTMAYIAPEQTGRMNRAVDCRADFYSLGVSYYRMLTGQLPFITRDALEMLHCHIARTPVPPHNVNTRIPAALSAICMKLLAKNAEDRYQSAQGIVEDLEYCRLKLENGESTTGFTLGRNDVSSSFRLPQKLYGREREYKLLLESYERILSGAVEIQLIAGFAGVGKSALIREIQKPIAAGRGYFIQGKFDRFQRESPYSALILALKELSRLMLTESEEQLQVWRKKLAQNLGNNARLLLEVLPDLEFLLPEIHSLDFAPGVETRELFQLTMQKFLQAIVNADSPLILFLDDLQWADQDSLNFLNSLVTAPDMGYVLLLGSYRANEADESHPLQETIDKIRSQGAHLEVLELSALDEESLNELLADTLHCSNHRTSILGKLIQNKTGGNPFFVLEFLKTLHAEQLLRFETHSHSWTWDMRSIEERRISDNVVDLMLSRIRELPDPTRRTLQLAACLGFTFDLRTLAVICKSTPVQTAIQLWPAVERGLIEPVGEGHQLLKNADESLPLEAVSKNLKYQDRFIHDRVQQAAYQAIDSKQRLDLHLYIGRLQLAGSSEEEIEENLFSIVTQFNKAGFLMEEEAEKLQIVELNLRAAQKARLAGAYASALNYLKNGLRLLPEGSESTHYSLTMMLYRELAENEYLAYHVMERSETYFDQACSMARTNLEKADICATQVVFYLGLTRARDAKIKALEALRYCGVDFPIAKEKMQEAINHEKIEIETELEKRRYQSLLELPWMTDESGMMALRILPNLAMCGYLTGDRDLLFLSVLKGVFLSLSKGQMDLTAYIYAWYGIILIQEGKFKQGYRFGKLALAMPEKYGLCREISQTYNLVGVGILHFGEPLKNSIGELERGYRIGFETGDLMAGIFNLTAIPMQNFARGESLDLVARQTKKALSSAERYKIFAIRDVAYSLNSLIQHLIRRPKNDDLPDHTAKEPPRPPVSGNSRVLTEFDRFQKEFWFGNYRQAHRLLRITEKTLKLVAGYMVWADHPFFKAMTLSRLYADFDETQKRSALLEMEKAAEQLEVLADTSAANFSHKHHLILAEIARLKGEISQAMDYYDEAIKDAQETGFIQIEALGNHFYAEFWLDQKRIPYAELHIKQARYLYEQWGAQAVAGDLEEKYPDLLENFGQTAYLLPGAHETLTGANADSSSIDLFTVFKSSQAISSEIGLERLLSRLMEIIIENAGAESGHLILEEDGKLLIEASADATHRDINVLRAVPLEDDPLLPAEIVRYVFRSGRNIILRNAAREGEFSRLPGVAERRLRSVLCVPVRRKDRTVGVLYLENNLVTGAFTTERVEILPVFLAQAAISIENALLYRDLEERVNERTLQLVKAREAAESANNSKSEFLANMSHEIRTPMNAILGFTEILMEQIVDPGRRRYLESINTSGKALLRLINDILDLSRIEAGKFGLEFHTVAPRDILEDLQRVFARNVDKKGLEFRIEIDSSLPRFLNLDEIRLRQILLNLVGNAVKFTDEGRIRLCMKRLPGAPGIDDKEHIDLQFTVEDTGIGIPQDEQELIFGAFEQRRDQSNAEYGGTGLGLAITRRLVEMMNGEINLESDLGAGSRFEIILRNLEVKNYAEKNLPSKEIRLPRITFQNSTILVVDDRRSNRELIRGYLESSKVNIIEAADAQEALNLAHKHLPNVILMDKKLPGMSGIEAIHKLKDNEITGDIPIILLTASAMKTDIPALDELNVSRIFKPFNKLDLIVELLNHLPCDYESPVRKKILKYRELNQTRLSPETATALLKVLNRDFRLLWEDLSQTQTINDVEDFAGELGELAQRYDYPALLLWAEDLQETAENFDVDVLPGLLKQFPELIARLEEMV